MTAKSSGLYLRLLDRTIRVRGRNFLGVKFELKQELTQAQPRPKSSAFNITLTNNHKKNVKKDLKEPIVTL